MVTCLSVCLFSTVKDEEIPREALYAGIVTVCRSFTKN
jgi:hypothetical protein